MKISCDQEIKANPFLGFFLLYTRCRGNSHIFPLRTDGSMVHRSGCKCCIYIRVFSSCIDRNCFPADRLWFLFEYVIGELGIWGLAASLGPLAAVAGQGRSWAWRDRMNRGCTQQHLGDFLLSLDIFPIQINNI